MIRLALLKIPSWAVVWSHWCRTRNLRLFFYMVSIGAQNLQETKLVFYILCSSWSWILYCLIIQFMFRMEIWISIAWRIWFRDLGYRHSWLGFLWFRFVLLLCLMQLVPLPLLLQGFFSFQLKILFYPSENLPPCDVVSKRNHFYQVLMYSFNLNVSLVSLSVNQTLYQTYKVLTQTQAPNTTLTMTLNSR